jgi:hypothetical protein
VSRLLFSHVIQSGYRRAYETGVITGHRLEAMQRLEQPLNKIYQRQTCWGEIHSIERFRQRWQQLHRTFFSSTSTRTNPWPKHYVIFSHGNLLTTLIKWLMSDGSDTTIQFGNHAPHCSVSILSYTVGDALPHIVLQPFQIFNRTLPITINNVSPRKIKLDDIDRHVTFADDNWQTIFDTIIRVC